MKSQLATVALVFLVSITTLSCVQGVKKKESEILNSLCEGQECSAENPCKALEANKTAEQIFAGGKGTALEPYLICTADELLSIESDLLTAHFQLLQSISLGSKTFDEAVIKKTFLGGFDGGGFQITDFAIQNVGRGFFEAIGEAGKVQNLHLSRFTVKTTAVANGAYSTGGLAGTLRGTVSSVHLTEADISGEQTIGGLVGSSSGIIEDSSVSGIIKGYIWTGGLVGDLHPDDYQFPTRKDVHIIRSYSRARIQVPRGSSYIGGLVGQMGRSTVLQDSYFRGTMEFTGSTSNTFSFSFPGAAVGSMYNSDLKNVYSFIEKVIDAVPARLSGIVGTLVVSTPSIIENSFVVTQAPLLYLLTRSSSVVSSPLPGLFANNFYTDNRSADMVPCYAGTLIDVCLPGTSTTGGVPFTHQNDKPLDTWDFVNTWEITKEGAYPTLKGLPGQAY